MREQPRRAATFGLQRAHQIERGDKRCQSLLGRLVRMRLWRLRLQLNSGSNSRAIRATKKRNRRPALRKFSQ
jgi:hypothetical protein